MKNVLVVGFGEIGKSMFNVIDGSGKYKIFKKDVEELDIEGPIDVMHVCIPFSEKFAGIVEEYIGKYSPKLTIVNSTVKPGTTEDIFKKTGVLIVHSPVRGRHPDLEGGIKRFVKLIEHINEEAGGLAKEHFEAMGVKSDVMSPSVQKKKKKILSTTFYAVNIAFHQDMDRMCDKYGANFKEAVTRFNETCTMDIEHKVPRPIMYPGFIGGHCLIPNIHILKEDIESDFLEAVLKSNELTKEKENEKEVEREKVSLS
jgi:UDP-N-acetyl-D-mannosaminuronate dehydrogenase